MINRPLPTKIVYHDPFFQFADQWHSEYSMCEVRVYKQCTWNDHYDEWEERVTCVVTTPLSKNGKCVSDGLSVTNGIEFIVQKLAHMGYIPDVVIEYMPHRNMSNAFRISPSLKEEFSIVEFLGDEDFTEPEWQHVDRDDVIRIINHIVPEWHSGKLWMQYAFRHTLDELEQAQQWIVRSQMDDQAAYDIVYRRKRDGAPVVGIVGDRVEWIGGFNFNFCTPTERKEIQLLMKAYSGEGNNESNDRTTKVG